MAYLTDEEIAVLRRIVADKPRERYFTLDGLGDDPEVPSAPTFGKAVVHTCRDQPHRVPFLEIFGEYYNELIEENVPYKDRQGHVGYRHRP